MRAAAGGTAPSRTALNALESWTEELSLLPEDSLSADHLAQAWGNLQLIMIECGPADEASDHAPAWRRVRRTAEEGFLALLARSEWSSLAADFREEVLPRLADAVVLPRAGRIARCIEAVRHLRRLAYRTSGMPHAWRIHRIAEMQYPLFTREGWHAREDIDYTPRRAQAVVRALLEEISINGPITDPLVVSYDSRVHADALAALVTEIATSFGIPVHLAQRDTPTPAALDYLTLMLGETRASGLIDCSAGHLPVKDPGAGRYTGHAYLGIRYFLPSGHAPFAEMTERLSRRAAEWLLSEESCSPGASPGLVTIFNPLDAYVERLVEAGGYTAVTVNGEEEIVQDVVRAYWSQPEARIVIDEMHGATRGYLRAFCEALHLNCEVLHGEVNLIFGDLGAANPEPPNLSDLSARIRELRDERAPLIGLAFNADGRQFAVVDETGHYLPHGAVLALLTDFLLNEGYPGEPGAVARGRATTRLIDRVVALPEYDGRTVPPGYHGHLPPYMRAHDYRQLAGDPQVLHGRAIHVIDERLLSTPDTLLVAGNARGEVTLGNLAYVDGLRAAIMLLQLCAVCGGGVRELWTALQGRVTPTHIERLELNAPDETRRGLLNRYMERYHGLNDSQLSSAEYRLGGCTVQYAGGVRDQFVEWALLDGDGFPAYLSINQLFPESAVRVEAEARDTEIAHRLLLAVAERMEELLGEELHRAENPWEVVEVLANVTSPLLSAGELPGTLNCRLAGEAYSRLQELARPGREAPDLMRFVTDRLRELQPEKARALAACHLGESPVDKKVPPPPRVYWEGEEM